MDLVKGALGSLQLFLYSTDGPLREPIALLVRTLRPRSAVMRASVLLDLPCRDVVLGVRMVVEVLKRDPELGRELEVADQLPVCAESSLSFGLAPGPL